MKTIMLLVVNRDACPVRAPANGDWGPQVPTCEHPEREARAGDPWCPNGPNQREDDPNPALRPFPPRCPLRSSELLKPLGG